MPIEIRKFTKIIRERKTIKNQRILNRKTFIPIFLCRSRNERRSFEHVEMEVDVRSRPISRRTYFLLIKTFICPTLFNRRKSKAWRQLRNGCVATSSIAIKTTFYIPVFLENPFIEKTAVFFYFRQVKEDYKFALSVGFMSPLKIVSFDNWQRRPSVEARRQHKRPIRYSAIKWIFEWRYSKFVTSRENICTYEFRINFRRRRFWESVTLNTYLFLIINK